MKEIIMTIRCFIVGLVFYGSIIALLFLLYKGLTGSDLAGAFQ